MKNFFNEFKKFIARGNVLDLAVAVIMGSAFGNIVSSLVSDVIMPIIGTIIGHNFSSLSIQINGSIITYGKFIQNVVDFLIISLCIFTFMKIINKFISKHDKEKQEEKEKEVPKSEEVLLLEEIRDLLKKQNSKKDTKKTKKDSLKD